jgi:hypothetical protein
MIVTQRRNAVCPLEDREFIVNLADSCGRARSPHHSRVLVLEHGTCQGDNTVGTGDNDCPWMRSFACQRRTYAFSDDNVAGISGANQHANATTGASQSTLHVTREPVHACQCGSGREGELHAYPHRNSLRSGPDRTTRIPQQPVTTRTSSDGAPSLYKPGP